MPVTIARSMRLEAIDRKSGDVRAAAAGLALSPCLPLQTRGGTTNGYDPVRMDIHADAASSAATWGTGRLGQQMRNSNR